ncbi:MAG: hypothetical protein IPN15_12665 [Saprospiraceae bacterium]|nr:hypothetical protein [Candidatus Vicinibacter affinis]
MPKTERQNLRTDLFRPVRGNMERTLGVELIRYYAKVKFGTGEFEKATWMMEIECKRRNSMSLKSKRDKCATSLADKNTV